MSSVLNIVKLDFSILKPFLKSYIFILISPLIITFTARDAVAGCVFLMSMAAMTSNFTFSISEKNDMNRLYGLLPVERKDIVIGRYLSVIISGLIAMIVGYFMNICAMFATKTAFTNEDLTVAMGIGMLLFIFNISIQLPGYFKFGAVKGKFISFIPFIFMALAAVIAQGLSKEQLSKLSLNPIFSDVNFMLGTSLIIDIILILISFAISVKIYQNIEL